MLRRDPRRGLARHLGGEGLERGGVHASHPTAVGVGQHVGPAAHVGARHVVIQHEDEAVADFLAHIDRHPEVRRWILRLDLGHLNRQREGAYQRPVSVPHAPAPVAEVPVKIQTHAVGIRLISG